MKTNDEKRKGWREQKQAYRKSRKEYTVALSVLDAGEVEAYANEKGLSVIEFIKAMIKTYKADSGYILPKVSDLKELVIEIRRIGNNVNQIARFINTNKKLDEIEIHKIQKHLSDLELIIVKALLNPPVK